MLFSLHIENIAVIKSVDIDFSGKFTALTGETGAGKSIIIDGINLLLGKKGEKELIRNGESACMVSGLFTDLSSDAIDRFSEVGIMPDEEGNLLVQRTLGIDGKSQVRINGRSVSLSVLKEIVPHLVNIHGQSDTHSLTDEKNHINILDTFAADSELLSVYRTAFSEYDRIEKEIAELTDKAKERARLIEVLEYQISDIDALELVDGEEEALIDKKLKIKNSERLTKQTGFVYKALKGSEKGSVSFLLDRSASALKSISDVIPIFSEYSEKLTDMLYQVEDIAEEVYAAVEDIDDDPTERLNEIESRLDKISKLKRKYGLTVKDVLEFIEKAVDELEKLKNADDYLDELTKKKKSAYIAALEIANKLHEERLTAAKKLEESVKETLEFLDMPKVTFVTNISSKSNGNLLSLNKDGYDIIEFLISANKGLDPKPLSKIASGGELARIMLALKNVIADKDGISTIIFDEIDAGVSGKTARKIGVKMLNLSRSCQLICVTHSAQIASLCDSHLLISKSDAGEKTETSVHLLDKDGRIAELSRILGGINITDAQRAAAADMLNERDLYSE